MGFSQQVDQDLIGALTERDSTTLPTLRLSKAADKNAGSANTTELFVEIPAVTRR